MKLKKRILTLTSLLLLISLLLCSCDLLFPKPPIDLDNIPEFANSPYVKINGNKPYFKESEIVSKSYESYSPLDSLGRCGVAIACIGIDIMPTEDREEINHVEPSGWVQAEYDKEIVKGRFLYNRCHLIGFQLTGENDRETNLITGTKYLNNTGMLPFENMVADYIEETENHVMYRVTPIFKGSELVARGVLMEAYSVEDEGDGICFCIYVYNNQPGITIDYSTGRSALSGEKIPEQEGVGDSTEEITYYLNTKTGKFHLEDCRYATGDNVTKTDMTRDELVADGKSPCGVCDP